jgi:hypothetical protein
MRNVACPTGVTKSEPFGTWAAGGSPGVPSVICGHFGQSFPRIHRKIHPELPRFGSSPGGKGGGAWPPGLTNRLPSKVRNPFLVFGAHTRIGSVRAKHQKTYQCQTKEQHRDFFIGGIDPPRAMTGQGKCSRYRKCPNRALGGSHMRKSIPCQRYFRKAVVWEWFRRADTSVTVGYPHWILLSIAFISKK